MPDYSVRIKQLVSGICEDHLRIITAYEPDESHWIEYKIRRKIE